MSTTISSPALTTTTTYRSTTKLTTTAIWHCDHHRCHCQRRLNDNEKSSKRVCFSSSLPPPLARDNFVSVQDNTCKQLHLFLRVWSPRLDFLTAFFRYIYQVSRLMKHFISVRLMNFDHKRKMRGPPVNSIHPKSKWSFHDSWHTFKCFFSLVITKISTL